jgi:hypothetical protein
MRSSRYVLSKREWHTLRPRNFVNLHGAVFISQSEGTSNRGELTHKREQNITFSWIQQGYNIQSKRWTENSGDGSDRCDVRGYASVWFEFLVSGGMDACMHACMLRT